MTPKTPEQIAREELSRYIGNGDTTAAFSEADMLEFANVAIEADRAQRSKMEQFGTAVYEIVRPWTAKDQANMDADDEGEDDYDSPNSFAHPDDEDRYRDLWNENMPRVSGCMYFAIPGEQAIHVTDEEAHHIMTYLSKENR